MNRRAEWSPRPRVGIMTYVHVERAGDLPLDNLVALVSPQTSKLFLFTGGDYRNDAHEMEIIRTTRNAINMNLTLSFIFLKNLFEPE